MKDNYFKVLENDIEKEYKIIKAFKHKGINYIIMMKTIMHLDTLL